jgi:hypothetical protein
MKPGLTADRFQLLDLIEQHDVTAGMYVRVHGDQLILGRDADGEFDDRVKLTKLGPKSYGVSVKRHTGRWQRTPFTGSMAEVVAAISSFLQHLVARY